LHKPTKKKRTPGRRGRTEKKEAVATVRISIGQKHKEEGKKYSHGRNLKGGECRNVPGQGEGRKGKLFLTKAK